MKIFRVKHACRKDTKDRNPWGGSLFRFARTVNGYYPGRAFHLAMATFWIEEYHIDGFRIDEFKGIKNWDFVREFTDRAHAVASTAFPNRPFIVIAEDSGRHAEATRDDHDRRRVVDAIWDFDFQTGLRHLICDRLSTVYGQPGRRERVRHLIDGARVWNDWDGKWRDHGFDELAQRIIYPTSHDVEAYHEQRLWPYFFDEAATAVGDFSLPGLERRAAAMDMIASAFALTCTAVGILMFLAGEEFGDGHDTNHSDWRKKMSDPVDWYREAMPGHRELKNRVRQLVALRTTMSCLHRKEVEFFSLDNGFHPDFDHDNKERLFCYCRTGGRPLGNPGQVAVVANLSKRSYPTVPLHNWPWTAASMAEVGGKGQSSLSVTAGRAEMALDPFQVRVFRT